MDLIFLNPEFKEKIWGGTKIKETYKMDIPSNKTGEAWVISGHINGITKVKSPKQFKGIGLDELYRNNRELFFGDMKLNDKNNIGQFPLLIKILDANDKLSVQVHPDDEYAKKNIGPMELGKNECWYILDAKEGAEIVYGHNAKTKDEFEKMIKEGDFDNLLKKIPVKKGDFFDVPSGTIHAIGSGILILETQQSSDTTFRVYDYDRVDDEGKKRELHIEESINVTNIPNIEVNNFYQIEDFLGGKITKLLSNEFFNVKKIEVNSNIIYRMEKKYLLMTAIEGVGKIEIYENVYNIKSGDSFIVPFGDKEMKIYGKITLIESSLN